MEKQIINTEDAVRWLLSDMDLETGRAILSELHPNRLLARNARHMSAKKVEYELKVLLGIPKTELFRQKCTNKRLLEKYGKITKNTDNIARHNGRDGKIHAARPHAERAEEKARPRVPADDHRLLQAKEAVSELAVEASKIHNALFETGEVNSPENTKARTEMLERLRRVTDMKEAVWKEKERYCDTGKASPELDSLLESYYSGTEDKPKEDIRKKDTAWLVKRKENVRRYITKFRNRLEYGTKTAQAEKHPMPPGPERAKTQKKLDEYIMELDKINKELERRNDK